MTEDEARRVAYAALEAHPDMTKAEDEGSVYLRYSASEAYRRGAISSLEAYLTEVTLGEWSFKLDDRHELNDGTGSLSRKHIAYCNRPRLWKGERHADF